MKIAAVLIYCSNEYRFLQPCLEELEKFSDQILVTVCDHFFDGSAENTQELENTFSEFPQIPFLYFPYIIDEIPKKLLMKIGDNFCCNFSRLIGAYFVKKEIDYILFLDADEIIEASSFLKWIKQYPLQNFGAVRLANYWYFREAKFRATTLEDSIVIARRKDVTKKVILKEGDRNAIFEHVKGEKDRHVQGLDGPFVHHFSWVRTKEEMLRKVTAWGHRKERDWKTLVEKEFAKPFGGTDFVHGYEFTEVIPYTKIDLCRQVSSQKKDKSTNVTVLSKKDLFQILGIHKWRRWLGKVK